VTYPPAQDPYPDPTRPLVPYEPPYSPPPAYYPGYPPPPVYVQPAPPPPVSGLAVASMVLAIIGLLSGCCTFGIPAILAVILGHVALAETRNGAKTGYGMAIAGLVMGYLLVLPALVFSIWILFAGGMAAISGS
jgi:hypothetical protein